jgi:20S proteasome alpha/beta subunit
MIRPKSWAGNMTVGVAICCKDGIVMGCDSLATFSRGAPVSRFTNKLFIIEHKDLLSPVAMVGAGMTAFMDKFLDRTKREGIGIAAAEIKRKLDIVDFVERVCETVVTLLVKEYAIDRNRFFGGPLSDFSLSMLIAGSTSSEHGAAELRAYNIHSVGLAESIDGYGTIGSGAPYAELFLHGLLPEPQKTSVKDAIGLGATQSRVLKSWTRTSEAKHAFVLCRSTREN